MPADDWEEIVKDRFHAAQPNRQARRSIAVNLPETWHPIVSAAAKQRDMSLSSFMRRAALAFAIADQGLDWAQIMEDEPQIQNYAADAPSVADHGFGHGAWKIEGLGEYRVEHPDS